MSETVPTGGHASGEAHGWQIAGATGGGAGNGWRPVTAPTAENVPNLSLRDQSADWSWQSVSPAPIFNVFKSQFENSDIFNFQLSIFNSPVGGEHVANNVRRYGQASSGRGAWPADCRRYRRGERGDGGRPVTAPTGGGRRAGKQRAGRMAGRLPALQAARGRRRGAPDRLR